MNFSDITHATDVELEGKNNRALQDGRAPSFQLEKRYIRKDGRAVWIELHGFLARNNEGKPQFGVGVVLDINDRKKADQRQQLLLNELNHRVKNTLAVIQSIAMHTLRDQFDPSAFKTTFNARLMAVSRAHDLLTRRSWQGVILGDVMGEAASPFDDKSEVHRVEVSGPDVLIEANAAVTLSMMMHELFTNAVKYGALSTVSGKVSLTWSCVGASVKDRGIDTECCPGSHRGLFCAAPPCNTAPTTGNTQGPIPYPAEKARGGDLRAIEPRPADVKPCF